MKKIYFITTNTGSTFQIITTDLLTALESIEDHSTITCIVISNDMCILESL